MRHNNVDSNIHELLSFHKSNNNTTTIQGNQQLKTYKGAVAIVTGDGGCIGQALAEELARKGAHAVMLRDHQPTKQVAVGLHEKGTEVKVYQVDVRDADEMQRVVEETVEAFGRVDYMCGSHTNVGKYLCIGTAALQKHWLVCRVPVSMLKARLGIIPLTISSDEPS